MFPVVSCPYLGIFFVVTSLKIYIMNEVLIELNGVIDHYGYQRSNAIYLLKKNSGSPVRFRINSFGGSVNDAMAIARAIEEHGNVTVEFAGFCASAVTWLAFSAKHIVMRDDAFWLCHKSSTRVDVYGSLNADQIADTIKKLENSQKSQEAIDLIIAEKYHSRCQAKGKTLADVFALMTQERWLNADETLEWGFIDEIQKSKAKTTLDNDARAMIIENLAAINLPVPAFFNKPEEPKLEKSLFRRFFDELKMAFNQEVPQEPVYNDNENNPITNQNSFTMNKTFVTVLSLLAVEALSENDGKITLSIEQMQALENALKENKAHADTIKNVEEELDAISDTIKGFDGVLNKVNAVKMVLDKVPGQQPVTQAQVTEGDNLNEIAKDPVNNYVKEDI